MTDSAQSYGDARYQQHADIFENPETSESIERGWRVLHDEFMEARDTRATVENRARRATGSIHPQVTSSLTERQRKILRVIRDSIQHQGSAPCFREIGEAVGLSSKSSVSYQISQLQEKGYLRRSTGPCQPISLAD